MIRLGLKVVRVGKPSAVSEALWDCTLDAAIGRDEVAQKAIKNAARATTRLSKCSKGSPSTGALSERTLREVATAAVKASIQVRRCQVLPKFYHAQIIILQRILTSTLFSFSRLAMSRPLKPFAKQMLLFRHQPVRQILGFWPHVASSLRTMKQRRVVSKRVNPAHRRVLLPIE
jgi:hypothetical protein